MSLYQCEECGVIENTALGWCHGRNLRGSPDQRKLCSVCAPIYFIDGSPTGFTGKWHGRFPQEFHPIGTMETDEQGNIRPKQNSRKLVTPPVMRWDQLRRKLYRPLPLPYGIATSYASAGLLHDEILKAGASPNSIGFGFTQLKPRVLIVLSRVLDRGDFHVFETWEEMSHYVKLEDDTRSPLWDEARERWNEKRPDAVC